MGPKSLAILELLMELPKPLECEIVLALVFNFFKLFFILVINEETKAQKLSRELGPAAASLPTLHPSGYSCCGFQVSPPAAEGLGRSLDKNMCLAGLMQDELEN